MWLDLTLVKRRAEHWSGVYSAVTSFWREVKQAKCSRSISAGNYRYLLKQALRTEKKKNQAKKISAIYYSLQRGKRKQKKLPNFTVSVSQNKRPWDNCRHCHSTCTHLCAQWVWACAEVRGRRRKVCACGGRGCSHTSHNSHGWLAEKVQAIDSVTQK